MLLLLGGVAFSQEPTIAMSDSGLKATIVVHAEPEQVKLLLADPEALYELSPDVVSVQILETRGECQELRTETKGVFSNIVFIELRCPSANGVTHRLVESDTFSRYNVDWSVREVEDGTELTYELEASLSSPLPDRLLHQFAADAAATQLANIYARYEDGRK